MNNAAVNFSALVFVWTYVSISFEKFISKFEDVKMSFALDCTKWYNSILGYNGISLVYKMYLFIKLYS